MDGTGAPALAVSTVIFGLREHAGSLALHLPLVRRIRDPWLGVSNASGTLALVIALSAMACMAASRRATL